LILVCLNPEAARRATNAIRAEIQRDSSLDLVVGVVKSGLFIPQERLRRENESER
jgi:hypothetical protein